VALNRTISSRRESTSARHSYRDETGALTGAGTIRQNLPVEALARVYEAREQAFVLQHLRYRLLATEVLQAAQAAATYDPHPRTF
jgi:Spy/CpxP family protein refolding chaperone